MNDAMEPYDSSPHRPPVLVVERSTHRLHRLDVIVYQVGGTDWWSRCARAG